MKRAIQEESREAFREQMVAEIPRWYSPWAHLAVPSLVILTIIAACIYSIHDLRAWQLLTIPVVWIGSNAFEWRVHRDVLHRRIPLFGELYERHTPQHHRIFLTDDMEMRSRREFRLVLIPAVGVLGIALVDILPTWCLYNIGQPNIAALFLATSLFYAISYEWLHLAYHLPKSHFIGRLPIIARLRRHHATHHNPELMQKWNFNVTIPLWDWIRGTIWRKRTQHPNQ